MPSERPDPDALLAQVREEEGESGRGTLRIFFGYAAGVGKTYSMLEAAHREKTKGKDIVIGYLEPHARPETQQLAGGLEAIPVREYAYRGVNLREFDLDAALARHPEIILVDELAHTNAPGSRHEKRWQDVGDLLNAGIQVWTTLNVQHIESLNDVVGQITGVVVRETIPDRVFDAADELELVDITPEELLGRLDAGKIYLPEQAKRALEKFFQKGNLTALRELSLRQAARRVHTDVETARRNRAAVRPWATTDRLLVCVGPSPTTARVIRTAKRMATALDAQWLAVAVDVAGSPVGSAASQEVARHFRLAERLGAESLTLAGQDVAETILDLARARNVTKILVGKTNQPRWKRLFWGTVVDSLLEKSGDIDVYVIHGEKEIGSAKPVPLSWSFWDILPYGEAVAGVAIAGIASAVMRSYRIADAEANRVMMFLAAVALIAFWRGRGPAILASVLGVLVFDFFFVPPFYDFAISDVQYLVTFGVMLAIGLLIGTLASRLRAQVDNTRLRERRTAMLYSLGKELSSLYGKVFLVGAAGSRISEMLKAEVAIYLGGPNQMPEIAYGEENSIADHPVSLPAVRWVIDHDQIAGAGTDTLPNAIALFLPLLGSVASQGAIGIRVADPQRLLAPDTRLLLEACANQLALALERDQLAIDAAEARIEAESEQVRSTLLSGVSHDLKTPLAAIAGASSSLLDARTMDEPTRRRLLETVAEEANRLNRLLENILQMSRLEAGAIEPNKQWHVLEEVIGSALRRTSGELEGHPVELSYGGDLPLVFVDGLLLEQVFVNLLENSARHTPTGTKVRISARGDGERLTVVVSDNGPGLPPGLETKVFEKFFRVSQRADGGRGSGLGLAICHAIMKTQGGSIQAANRPGGGAEFVLTFPIPKNQPKVELE